MSKTNNEDYFNNLDKNEKEQEQINALDDWQNGNLINHDVLNKMSLKELQRVAKILEGIK
jgi:hypothetical protein|tara:strand:+ start:46 stop:225 length:180 start_codon:yes stop_codon:yes gene_type:complete